MTLSPLGDSAVVVALGAGAGALALPRVRALAAALAHDPPAGLVDIVPAFASVTVFYNPVHAGSYASLCAAIEVRAARADAAVVAHDPRVIEIPVCYGGELGAD